jgi:hypothetical protein
MALDRAHSRSFSILLSGFHYFAVRDIPLTLAFGDSEDEYSFSQVQGVYRKPFFGMALCPLALYSRKDQAGLVIPSQIKPPKLES